MYDVSFATTPTLSSEVMTLWSQLMRMWSTLDNINFCRHSVWAVGKALRNIFNVKEPLMFLLNMFNKIMSTKSSKEMPSRLHMSRLIRTKKDLIPRPSLSMGSFVFFFLPEAVSTITSDSVASKSATLFNDVKDVALRSSTSSAASLIGFGVLEAALWMLAFRLGAFDSSPSYGLLAFCIILRKLRRNLPGSKLLFETSF